MAKGDNRTDEGSTIIGFARQLAEICDDAAGLVLRGPRPTNPDEVEDPTALPYEAERRYFLDEFGSDEASAWIGETTSTYLVESAHLCVAIAQLLRAGTVAVAIDPLVRAIIERIGRVVWVLDPEATPKERAARAGLEMTVSQQHYRASIDQLADSKAPKREAREELVRLRGLLDEWFDVDRPPVDPFDASSDPTPQIDQWSVESQTYPNYADATARVVSDGPRRKAIGSYGGLSGFSHPNVVFSREHRHIDADGAVTYSYPAMDLEKATRFAAFVMLNGARRWAAYFEASKDELQQRIDELGARMDEISVLGDDANG